MKITQAGIQGRNLKARPETETKDEYWLLASSSWLPWPAFFYNPGLPAHGTTAQSNFLPKQSSITNQRTAPKTFQWDHLIKKNVLFSWGSLFPDDLSLYEVDSETYPSQSCRIFEKKYFLRLQSLLINFNLQW